MSWPNWDWADRAAHDVLPDLLRHRFRKRIVALMIDSPRIPMLEPENMDAEQSAVFRAVVSGRRGRLVGPLRAAIHSPKLADRWQKLGEYLRYDTVLPPVLSELAILLTARRWNSELEWTIHAQVARDSGLAESVIEAIRDGCAPELNDPAQREFYNFVCELQNDGRVSDTAYAAVLARWDVIGVVELTALTGYYVMVAMTLNTHRIPLPNGEAPQLAAADGDLLPLGLSTLPPLRPNDESL